MRFIFILICLVQACQSATYYVDFVGGNDAANGTSTSTPWQHCPGDSLATGTSAGTTVAAGDTVVFKGGVNYLSTINLNFSGTPGSEITYDGNTAGTFGTGKPIFNGEHANSATRLYGFNGTTGRTNLIFRNLEFTQFGGHTNIFWDCNSEPPSIFSWGMFLQNFSRVYVTDCYFHDIGDWTNSAGMSVLRMDGVGISFYGSADFITVTNCEFTKIGHQAILISAQSGNLACTNIKILNCNMHDYITWGVNISANNNGVTIRDILIDGLIWHDYYQYAPDTWLGCNGLFPHNDGVICFLGNFPPVINCNLGTSNAPLTIRNCTFYNNSATADNAGTADIFLTAYGGRVLIYNNTFVNVLNQGEGGIYAQDGISMTNGSTWPDYVFFNNSFYDQRNQVMLQSPTSSGQYALTNGGSQIRILNNAFFKTDTSFSFPIEWGVDDYSKPTQMDYNSYFTVRSDKNIASIRTNGVRGELTFPQVQSFGWEAHGMYTNPVYTVTNALGANSSLCDLHLLSNSPLIDIALDLSSIETLDKDGNTRPAGKWDIGAFEFIAGSSPSISVSPSSLNFGTLLTNTSSALTFGVTNTGSGDLVGTASTSSPFSITSPPGGTYSLLGGAGLLVTVQYSPTTAGSDSGTVTCTGGGGATVSLSGSATNAPFFGVMTKISGNVTISGATVIK